MPRPLNEKKHLYDKRDELIWALDFQGYNGQEIGTIFNVNRSQIHRVIKKKPSEWRVKWTKLGDG